MQLLEVALLSDALARQAGRNAKIDALAGLLARATGPTAEAVAAWLSGELRQGRIGVGWAALDKALRALAAPPEGATLTVEVVDEAFASIAAIAGAGSTQRRLDALAALFAAATAPERGFLVRLLSGGLRQGALDGLVSAALARAHALPEAEVRRAHMLAGSLPAVARALAEGGPGALARFRLELFRPVLPMLADTAEDLDELTPDLAALQLEVKLDGARIQVHKRGDEVRVYSRALNEVTEAVPEVVEATRALPVHTAILDGEVIALRGDGRPHPFQTTMRRFGRRLDVDGLRHELPVTPFVFDVLRLDDEELLLTPFEERRRRLEALCAGLPAPRPTRAVARPTPDEARAFFAEVLAQGHEGLMAKRLDSAYEAGQRGSSWLKLKPAKTLDLVVLAVEQGSGRRARWLSNLHLGAREDTPEGPRFVMLGKTFKGLSDELLAWQTRELSARETHREGHVVYVRPELVVEIAYQELEASPRYPAGLALRFARVKGYRPDKRAQDADTVETARRVFDHQRGAAPEAPSDATTGDA